MTEELRGRFSGTYDDVALDKLRSARSSIRLALDEWHADPIITMANYEQLSLMAAQIDAFLADAQQPTLSAVDTLEDYIARILQVVGADDDMTEEMWRNTPRRTASWLREYAHDKPVTLDEVLQPRFPEQHNELVLVRNISFSSLCAHHLLPFTGTATVGYLPNGTVVGLSKLARAVQHVAQRVTLQERITQQLADGIYNALNPHGVVVLVEADHLCMRVRGIRDPHVETVTLAKRGEVDTHQFLTLAKL